MESETYYYPTGEVEGVQFFHKNGELLKTTYFHKTGEVKQVFEYVGISTSDEMRLNREYIDGKRSYETLYHDTGEVKHVFKCINNKLLEAITYYKTGDI